MTFRWMQTWLGMWNHLYHAKDVDDEISAGSVLNKNMVWFAVGRFFGYSHSYDDFLNFIND